MQTEPIQGEEPVKVGTGAKKNKALLVVCQSKNTRNQILGFFYERRRVVCDSEAVVTKAWCGSLAMW